MFETFHFALQPGGQLFLGSSESVEDGSPLFTVLDKKHRHYARRATPRAGLPVPMGPGTLALALETQHGARSGPVIAGPALVPPTAPASRTVPGLEGRASSWGELHLKLIEHLSPPSILIDAEYDIVHLSPGAGRFLQFGGGEPSQNLLRAIHPALRIELRAALYQAVQNQAQADVADRPVELGGEAVYVEMSVRPVQDLAPGLLLVILKPVVQISRELGVSEAEARGAQADPLARHLDRELERLKLHLRDTVEQYEASNEELKASNEELQAMNEELRSATEELETSREELQSINEELTTVNHELKSKVDELGHSNSDMHNLMDATAIATVFLDRELRITRYTPSAVALFNLIPTDVGRPLTDLTTHLDYSSLGDDALRVLERLVPVEREVGEASGNWYLVRVLPYRTLDDRIAGIVLTLIDITERKRSQEALRESEGRFSAIVDQATVGVVQTSLDGRITYTNRGFLDLLGVTDGQPLVLDRLLQELVHVDDRPQFEQQFTTLSKLGLPIQLELRCQRRDGSVAWLHCNIGVLADSAGRPKAALLVCADVSERKYAEEALRASEERFRVMVENAVDYAIFSTDPDGVIASWNAGAQRLLGYAAEEVLNQPYDIIFTPEDRASGAPAAELGRARLQGRASQDRLHVRKDGSAFWASGAVMAMNGGEKGGIVGFVKILRDQSEIRSTQRAIEQGRADLLHALEDNQAARTALESANAAKDRFLATLSHELRNPLAAIANAAQLLRDPALQEGELPLAAGIVQRQAATAKLLLDDLHDVARLRLGRLVMHRRLTSLSEIVEVALETTRPQLDAAGVRFDLTLPGEAETLVADPMRISQVLSNLLSNAAKYTPASRRVSLLVRSTVAQLEFVVEDEGIGMAPDIIESMFDMFSQDPAAQRHSPHGLGIGLALVRYIVVQHGGQVEGHSEGLGKGSRFVVVLPRDGAAAGSEPAPAQAMPFALPISRHDPGEAAARVKPARILIVDDNADATWGLVRLLELSGREIHSTAYGEEALRLVLSLRPDVIILDIGLPDLSGLEVARRLRKTLQGRRVTLVAATGWGREADREAALAAGFDVHLVKPVNIGELLAVIEAHERGPSDG